MHTVFELWTSTYVKEWIDNVCVDVCSSTAWQSVWMWSACLSGCLLAAVTLATSATFIGGSQSSLLQVRLDTLADLEFSTLESHGFEMSQDPIFKV